jgi:hypothetical protein
MDNRSTGDTTETRIKRIIDNPESLLPIPLSFVKVFFENMDWNMILDDDPRRPYLEKARRHIEKIGTEGGEQVDGLNVLEFDIGRATVALLVSLGAEKAIATAQFDFNGDVATNDPRLIAPAVAYRPKTPDAPDS